MSNIFNSAEMASLRYANIHRHLVGYLDDLDRDRFRSLGEKNRDAFIKEGINYCDSLELEFLEQFEYVHFIMYFLGTHFHNDPRYQGIALRLAQKGITANERIQNAHEFFVAVGERFIGPELKIAKAAMVCFEDAFGKIPDTAFEGRQILDAYYEAIKPAQEDRKRFPEQALMDAAVTGADILGINIPQGQNLALVLALWLGAGFYHDPLFPWIVDIPDKRGENPYERYAALKDYSLKRFQKMMA